MITLITCVFAVESCSCPECSATEDEELIHKILDAEIETNDEKNTTGTLNIMKFN